MTWYRCHRNRTYLEKFRHTRWVLYFDAYPLRSLYDQHLRIEKRGCSSPHGCPTDIRILLVANNIFAPSHVLCSNARCITWKGQLDTIRNLFHCSVWKVRTSSAVFSIFMILEVLLVSSETPIGLEYVATRSWNRGLHSRTIGVGCAWFIANFTLPYLPIYSPHVVVSCGLTMLQPGSGSKHVAILKRFQHCEGQVIHVSVSYSISPLCA